MRELIRPHAKEYRRVVLRDKLPEDMDVKGALKVISISNCSEPLQHGVIILCPARARLALRIASVGTPFSSCPYSSQQCKCRRGMSEQLCLRGNNARKLVVWQAGGRGVSSRRGKTTRKVIHSKALLLAETPPPAAEAGPSTLDKAAAFIVP